MSSKELLFWLVAIIVLILNFYLKSKKSKVKKNLNSKLPLNYTKNYTLEENSHNDKYENKKNF